MIKHIISSSLMFLVLLALFVAPALGTTVSIEDASGNYSESIEVPISMSDASSIAAMDIRLTYDPTILQATGVSNGSLLTALPSFLIASNVDTSGVVNISFATVDGINGSGVLSTVSFNVIGGGDGAESSLTLSEVAAYNLTPIINTTNASIVDGYYSVPIDTVNGTFTVINGTSMVPGELDGMPGITANDALIALRMSVGLVATNDAADVDGMPGITANDALQILRASVGLVTL